MNRSVPFCRRVGAVAAFVAVLVAVAGAAPGARASGGVRLTQCLGTQTIAFNPRLTSAPRPTKVTFTERFTRCLGGEVAAGQGTGTSVETTSCTAVTVPTATAVYRWNTGRSSTVHWATNAVSKVNGTVVVVATGTVTKGVFAGARASSQVVLPQLGLAACLGRGVSTISGVDTLTLVR